MGDDPTPGRGHRQLRHLRHDGRCDRLRDPRRQARAQARADIQRHPLFTRQRPMRIRTRTNGVLTPALPGRAGHRRHPALPDRHAHRLRPEGAGQHLHCRAHVLLLRGRYPGGLRIDGAAADPRLACCLLRSCTSTVPAAGHAQVLPGFSRSAPEAGPDCPAACRTGQGEPHSRSGSRNEILRRTGERNRQPSGCIVHQPPGIGHWAPS